MKSNKIADELIEFFIGKYGKDYLRNNTFLLIRFKKVEEAEA